jgi:hypothetical protein
MRLLKVFLEDPCCDLSDALDVYKEQAFDGFSEYVHGEQRWRCHSRGPWLKPAWL